MNLPDSLAALVKERLSREIRDSLESFATYALAPLGFKPAAHHRLLISKLEAVERGDIKRLMVFMPPGSAKSTYASVLFPAWYMARNASKNIIAASHTADLADDFSKKVQNVVRENSEVLGYGMKTEAVSLWRTTNNCAYKAAGVGGPLTGFRSSLSICDDPVKSRKDAESESYRNTAYNWFKADFSTRSTPGAPMIIIQTRWHESDLSGRLLEDNPTGWDVLSLPAIAGEHDALGREPGEPLWADDKYGYGAALKEIERESGERDWYSLYQQSPRPLTGSIFKTDQIGVLEAIPAGLRPVRAWDLASTAATGTRNPDWTVGVLLAKTNIGSFVVLDVVRLRGGPEETEQAILNTARLDGRQVPVLLPQDPGQAGKMQIAYFTKALMGYTVRSSPETGDKATRAMPVASQVNVGNFSIVSAPWNRAFLDELAGFPGGAKDDIVDSLSRAFSDIVNVQSSFARFAALAS